MDKEEKKKIKDGLFLALSFILILWIVKLIEINFDISFVKYSMYPRKLSGLKGIVTTPLIHENLMHLFNNSVPLFVSIIGIMYFFRKHAFQIFALIYLVTHFIIWLTAPQSFIIGASGLVYAYLSFLFFVSAFSNNKNMLALSLILIFAYGTMIWGIIPVNTNISWESHLIGAITGFVFAIIYKNKGPKEEKFDWEDEEEFDEEKNIDQMDDDEINELIYRNIKK